MTKPNPIPPGEQHYEDLDGNYVGKGVEWTYPGDRIILTPEGKIVIENELPYCIVDCSYSFNKTVKE